MSDERLGGRVFLLTEGSFPIKKSIILTACWTPERMTRARSFFGNRPFLMREQYQERSFLSFEIDIN